MQLWRLQVLETARAAFEASSQRVSLTNLSGRRDMSLLLALSATQVRCLVCGWDVSLSFGTSC